MKGIFNLVVCLWAINSCFSQDKVGVAVNNQFKINYYLLGIDASYELALNKSILWETGVGIGAGGSIRDRLFVGESFQIDFTSFPVLRLRSRLKYVYNRAKRFRKGKDITYNSGNYIAIQGTFSSKKENIANDLLLTDVVWGIQRSLGGKWLFNVNTGLGYAKDFDTQLSRFYPTLGIAFSYMIF
ncbi:hypothetical protein [Tenacibaculum maritimum]|uniref:hypothetical protein n=1 Tax=Tenacibaculum maritimum TaxID=107401 RepID=UPI0012E66583|nr:hypothetical protein [Tenacibaculum maritimum]MCD9610741.1 hypothetical protein [Tenacibaculum maritimum]CAA0200664.1 conserved hypothetical protein [Tenacibaculum maritimum]